MRQLLTLLLIWASVSSFAQSINLVGKVEDAFLHIPLPKARITVFTTDSTMVQDSVFIVLYKKL